jgi:hypothetical protein
MRLYVRFSWDLASSNASKVQINRTISQLTLARPCFKPTPLSHLFTARTPSCRFPPSPFYSSTAPLSSSPSSLLPPANHPPPQLHLCHPLWIPLLLPQRLLPPKISPPTPIHRPLLRLLTSHPSPSASGPKMSLERKTCNVVTRGFPYPTTQSRERSENRRFFWQTLPTYIMAMLIDAREEKRLTYRWAILQHRVNKFNGCFNQIIRLNQSGIIMPDILNKAHELYGASSGGKKFALLSSNRKAGALEVVSSCLSNGRRPPRPKILISRQRSFTRCQN